MERCSGAGGIACAALLLEERAAAPPEEPLLPLFGAGTWQELRLPRGAAVTAVVAADRLLLLMLLLLMLLKLLLLLRRLMLLLSCFVCVVCVDCICCIVDAAIDNCTGCSCWLSTSPGKEAGSCSCISTACCDDALEDGAQLAHIVRSASGTPARAHPAVADAEDAAEQSQAGPANCAPTAWLGSAFTPPSAGGVKSVGPVAAERAGPTTTRARGLADKQPSQQGASQEGEERESSFLPRASTSAVRDGACEFGPRGAGADAVAAAPSRSGGVATPAAVAKQRRPSAIKRAVELS